MVLITGSFVENIAEFFRVTTFAEWAGLVTCLACVWLAAKNLIWNWPVACLSVSIYFFIYFDKKLYADAGLQVYFLIMNLYGWYYWLKKRHEQTKDRKITMIKKTEAAWSVLAITIFTAVIGFTLYRKTDAAFPFVDSFCTACSIVAQVFLARKVLQNWLIWIGVNIIYVSVYFSKELYATSLTYAILIVIAFIGYLDWRKIYREQEN